jgi:hypothetical protein
VQPAAAQPARGKGRARKAKSQPPAAPVEPAAPPVARRAAKPARSREAAAAKNGHANGARARVPLRSDIVALRPKRGAEPDGSKPSPRKKTAAVSGEKTKKSARAKRDVAAQDA